MWVEKRGVGQIAKSWDKVKVQQSNNILMKKKNCKPNIYVYNQSSTEYSRPTWN